MTRALTISPAAPGDHDAIVGLWVRVGLTRPWIDARTELALKVRSDPDGMLVARLADDPGGRLAGTVMAGFEGHRGWVNYLAVEPHLRGTGVARRLMAAAEAYVRSLGAPKLNLQVRRDNLEVLALYRSLGYVDDDVVSLGKRLG